MQSGKYENLVGEVTDSITVRTIARTWQVALAAGTLIGVGFMAGAVAWQFGDLRETVNRRFATLEAKVERIEAAWQGETVRRTTRAARERQRREMCQRNALRGMECIGLLSDEELQALEQ